MYVFIEMGLWGIEEFFYYYQLLKRILSTHFLINK